jgi:hypothetical protein
MLVIKFRQNFSSKSKILRIETHKLINSILNKEELPDQWQGFIIVPI